MEWISVRSELPPKFKNVLAYSKFGHYGITCVDSSGEMDTFLLEIEQKDKWTHWMPLPNPPKQQNSQQNQ